MTRGSIARRYAKALLGIAQELGKVEEFGEQLKSFARVLTENGELFETLRNPAYPTDERKSVVVKVIEAMKLDQMVRNFILLVTDRRRIEYIPAMASSYRDISDNMAGRIRATITTATDLKEDKASRIAATLSKKLGKQIILTGKKDPQLIAGVVAEVGNLRFDTSLRNALKNMECDLCRPTKH